MRLSRTARTLLGVTALAWSIPFAQAGDDRLDREEPAALEMQRDRPAPGRVASLGAGSNRKASDDASSDK